MSNVNIERKWCLQYVGCLTINASMRSLDFDTRSTLTKDCIRRVCEYSGLKGQDKRKRCDKRFSKMIGEKPIMENAGLSVILTVSSLSLKLTNMKTGDIIANHDMPNISFASAGDAGTVDFVGYVAKDAKYGRACFVLECGGGLAQEVISTIGQAFDLRFKELLKKAPRAISNSRLDSFAESINSSTSSCSSICGAVGGFDRDYYNDLPGKTPPDIDLPPPPFSYETGSLNSLIDEKKYKTLPQPAPRLIKPKTSLTNLSDHSQNLIDFNTDIIAPNILESTFLPISSTTTVTTKQLEQLTMTTATVAAATNTTTTTTMKTESATLLTKCDPLTCLEMDSNNLLSLNVENKRDYVNCSPESKETSNDKRNTNFRDPFDMQPFNSILENDGKSELLSLAKDSKTITVVEEDHITANGYNGRRKLTKEAIEALKKEDWYHGPISRRESELLVANDGDFLIREQQGSETQYVLTGNQNGIKKHLLLVDPEGVVRTKDKSFDCISELINYHRDNNLPIVSAESVLLLRTPVKRLHLF